MTEDLLAAWPLQGGADLAEQLLAAYAHPSRHYHDTRHLAEVLDRIREIGAHGIDFDGLPVLLAAWFHDGVYDGQPDAERRSAAWAAEALESLAGPDLVEEVTRLVLLTETHRPTRYDVNGGVLSDADLGILAAPAPRYEEYAADVRREYRHLAGDVFVAGRARVLRDLLARPRLFHTAYARSAWEVPARANVERELERLSG